MAIRDKVGDKKNAIWYYQGSCKNISIIIRWIDKYEYLTGEEILPSDQSQIIEQAKFIYFSLGKALKK